MQRVNSISPGSALSRSGFSFDGHNDNSFHFLDFFSVDAMTLLVGREEEHPACKKIYSSFWNFVPSSALEKILPLYVDYHNLLLTRLTDSGALLTPLVTLDQVDLSGNEFKSFSQISDTRFSSNPKSFKVISEIIFLIFYKKCK